MRMHVRETIRTIFSAKSQHGIVSRKEVTLTFILLRTFLFFYCSQIRRGKGDNLEFSKFCKELMDSKLNEVVHKTTMDNIGEPVAAA